MIHGHDNSVQRLRWGLYGQESAKILGWLIARRGIESDRIGVIWWRPLKRHRVKWLMLIGRAINRWSKYVHKTINRDFVDFKLWIYIFFILGFKHFQIGQLNEMIFILDLHLILTYRKNSLLTRFKLLLIKTCLNQAININLALPNIYF